MPRRRHSGDGVPTAPAAGKIVRVAAKALKPPVRRVTGPDPDLPPVTITITRKKGMPRGPFERKARALQKLGEEGRLYKATNPLPPRNDSAKNHRGDLIRRLKAQYGESNPELYERLAARARDTDRYHPDHVWELQLGGPDEPSNLRLLDEFTNTDIGIRQIRPQIQGLPDGTPIRIKIINPHHPTD